MESGIDRRRFLKGAAGALAMPFVNKLDVSAAGREKAYEVFGSTLTPEELAEQKKAAIESLVREIPQIAELDHLREYAEHLNEESQMYIPDDGEIAHVAAVSGPQLHLLAQHTASDSYGLFVFADINREGKRTQRLYVVKKIDGTAVQFLKGYRVSTSRKGFSNSNDSERTPLGLHTIYNGHVGIFGEVVSGLNKFKEHFVRVSVDGEDHWFVKGFGLEHGNDVAEVVTDQYLLHSRSTDLSRGIRIHGTNRSGEVGPDGKWRSLLGGRRQSNGCIRMSNVDVRDLHTSGYILLPEEPEKKAFPMPVVIHATKAAIDATKIYD
jgi:hypothetical protein